MTEQSLAYLKNHPDEAQNVIERLCRQPSVAALDHGMGEAADLVEGLLAEAGFETRQFIVEGAPPYVYGEMKGRSDYTLLLYNHYDVQPADPLELWDSPPFEPTIRDGSLYARGMSDNKGEIGTRLTAIKALRAAHGGLPITVRWILEGEEEIGSPHFGAFAKEYAEFLQSDAALWEGSGFDNQDRPIFVMGFKGMLYVQYEVQGTGKDAHSGAAPVLPSAAWRLVQMLATLKNPAGKITIPGFYDDVRPPTPAELDALRGQPNMDEILLSSYQIDEFVDGLRGFERLKRGSFSPTANIAGLLSGYTEEGVKTVLPAKAMGKMDFRLVPHQDPTDIFNKLCAYLRESGYSDIEVKQLGGAPPVVTPIETPFAQRMLEIGRKFSGVEPHVHPLSGGTLPLLGPLQQYAPAPGLSAPGGPGYWGSGAHAPNEHIRVSDIERAVRFNIYMLEELGK